MVSTTTTRSRTIFASSASVRAQLIAWGLLMAAIYAIYVIVFPLTPTIYQSDHVLEIEQMLRPDRKWFAPVYVLGLFALFYSFWRVMKLVHAVSNVNPPAAKSLRIWALESAFYLACF